MSKPNQSNPIPVARKSKNRFIHGIMLLNVMLVASSFPVGAAITHALPPAVMMALRFMLAALLFAPYVFFRNGFRRRFLKNTINYMVISIPLVLFFLCMFESLRYTSPMNTGALFTIVPTITALLAMVLSKDTVGRFRALGLFTGTLGAVWIIFRGDVHALVGVDLNYGDTVFFAGCIALGLYNVLIKKLYGKEPMEVLTFWVLCWGSVWLLAISWPDLGHIDWSGVEMKVYAGIAYLSLFTTLITFFLTQFSIVRIGPTKASAYGFLTPVFVILMGMGGEPFVPMTIPGIVLVAAAMVLIQREKNQVHRTD